MTVKKKLLVLMAALLAFGGSAGAAFADKPDHAGNSNKIEATTKVKTDDEAKIQLDSETEGTVTSDTYGDGDTVTSDTYGKGKGPQGYKGLLNAIGNVKDKPAGSVIANLLLTKYETKLTAEQKAELEGIVEADKALTAVADLLDEQGSVTEAVYVQKEAVKANLKNLESYKKLGKLYEKIGKTGVKLYVNGDEPNFEVAPFIRDGSTLVPFRAISEALKAEVSWNPEERSVTVTRGDITVKLFIGSTTALLNGQEITLEVPAEIVDGSTVVPVRFVSESLKADVQWEGETQSVVINENV